MATPDLFTDSRLGTELLHKTDVAPVAASSDSERTIVSRMLDTGTKAPLTSSVGRLFDAVAALVNLRQQNRFEGQAAMVLEHLADVSERYYDVPLRQSTDGPAVADWEPMVRQLHADLVAGVDLPEIAARFDNGLAELIVAAQLAERSQENVPGSSG